MNVHLLLRRVGNLNEREVVKRIVYELLIITVTLTIAIISELPKEVYADTDTRIPGEKKNREMKSIV